MNRNLQYGSFGRENSGKANVVEGRLRRAASDRFCMIWYMACPLLVSEVLSLPKWCCANSYLRHQTTWTKGLDIENRPGQSLQSGPLPIQLSAKQERTPTGTARVLNILLHGVRLDENLVFGQLDQLRWSDFLRTIARFAESAPH